MRKAMLLLAVLGLVGSLWAQGPFDGTWKIDINQNIPQGQNSVVVLQSGTFQCTSCNPKIDIKADGTDQAVPPETKEYDMMALKILDDKAVETKAKKDGKLIRMTKNLISADGKTSTIEITNYPEPGKQPFVYKLTYNRVAEGPSGSHAISGTWRMGNYSTVLTVTCKSTPDGLISTGPTGQSIDAKFDGKDYPVQGATAGTTISLNKVNERTIDETVKQSGKIVTVIHMTVSADGKTMTIVTENKEQNTTTTLTATKQ
jgi:hypothetical protein